MSTFSRSIAINSQFKANVQQKNSQGNTTCTFSLEKIRALADKGILGPLVKKELSLILLNIRY